MKSIEAKDLDPSVVKLATIRRTKEVHDDLKRKLREALATDGLAKVLKISSIFASVNQLDSYEFKKSSGPNVKFRRVKVDGGAIRLVFERLHTGAQTEMTVQAFLNKKWTLVDSIHTRTIIKRIKLRIIK